MNLDPLTGQPLPANAIQRILFVCPNAHVYQIPPLRSTKGHAAADWTSTVRPTAQEIFQPRLRLLETAIPAPDSSSEQISVNLLLEDKSSGELFAAVPYTDAGAVEPAIDSSRFFAIRVVGEGGRKAVLGLGFEERSDAVDFSIALQDARKTLGWEAAPPVGGNSANPNAAARGRRQQPNQQPPPPQQEKRDFRLKEGEMITVNIGQRGRRAGGSSPGSNPEGESQDLSRFALRPPPSSGSTIAGASTGSGSGSGSGGAVPFLAPPPSAREAREEKRRSFDGHKIDAKDLGFDDGEFGEFQ